MPSCFVVNEYQVTEVQKGLKVLASERAWSIDPGPVDGLWGPRTRRALRDFLNVAGCPAGDLTTLTNTWDLQQTGQRTTAAPEAVMEGTLIPAARRYTAPTRRARPEEAGPVPENGNEIVQAGGGFSRWGWWIGGATAAVAIVAFIWWWQKKKRR